MQRERERVRTIDEDKLGSMNVLTCFLVNLTPIALLFVDRKLANSSSSCILGRLAALTRDEFILTRTSDLPEPLAVLYSVATSELGN